jgi:hypothetical protein
VACYRVTFTFTLLQKNLFAVLILLSATDNFFFKVNENYERRVSLKRSNVFQVSIAPTLFKFFTTVLPFLCSTLHFTLTISVQYTTLYTYNFCAVHYTLHLQFLCSALHFTLTVSVQYTTLYTYPLCCVWGPVLYFCSLLHFSTLFHDSMFSKF